MVEKFNLMAREMNKKVKCGLSVEYKYISQSEIAEVLKTAGYKAKFKIIVHVINHDERRSYYWDVETFKNRYEIAEERFHAYFNKSEEDDVLLLNNLVF